MSLKSVLQRAGQAHRGVYHNALPPEILLQAVSASLAERFDDKSAMPTREELSSVLRRFCVAHAGGSLAQITLRDWSRSIWGIWDPSSPIGKLDGFWLLFESIIKNAPRRIYIKNLIFAYLRAFDQQDEGIQHSARIIREFIERADQPDWIWSKRHAVFRLFTPSIAPTRVAEHVMASHSIPEQAMAEVGCVGVAALGGMEEAAYAEALTGLQVELSEAKADLAMLKRFLDWSTKKDKLRFERMRTGVAESLLSPWRMREPEADIRKAILEFLLRHLGDPRIDRKGWIGVAEENRHVMRRWLTQASLDQFIQVVSRVADKSHWKYRRAFWKAYFDRGYIEEAWVLFGADARLIIHRAAEEITGYGLLRGGQSNHCVLLLKIGGLTIADWSHNGSCRIWNPENASPPRLYQNYRAEELRANADFEQAHHGSHQHTWQGNIARYIQQYTKIWVNVTERTP